jgi:alkylation response protein AidB-like acyl-CoA dehydrogenase
MDFQQGEQERENGARIAKILATFMDRVEAMELADVPAARGILLQMQAALAAEDVGRALDDQGAWPQAIANGLDVAKVSTSLFLALQATRQCAMIAGGGPHDRIGAVALTEPGGPRAASVRLAGPPWRLNGRKAFVTNGPVADVRPRQHGPEPSISGAGGASPAPRPPGVHRPNPSRRFFRGF